MNTKSILTGLGILAALILGAVGVTQTPVNDIPTDIGAVTGPDMPYPYIAVNGVRTYYNNQTFKTATTTVCAVQSPVATSTLVSAVASFTFGSTTTSIVTFGKAATAFATTTVIATSSLAANAAGTFIGATTTPPSDSANGRATINDRTFAPNTYLVIGMTPSLGSVTGTFSPTGRCIANFMETENVQ